MGNGKENTRWDVVLGVGWGSSFFTDVLQVTLDAAYTPSLGCTAGFDSLHCRGSSLAVAESRDAGFSLLPRCRKRHRGKGRDAAIRLCRCTGSWFRGSTACEESAARAAWSSHGVVVPRFMQIGFSAF